MLDKVLKRKVIVSALVSSCALSVHEVVAHCDCLIHILLDIRP